MSTVIKYIDIKEFREEGYLQELNRQFLHPLGLALEINQDEDGNESLSGVWDYRDDKEGITFGDDTKRLIRKAKYIRELWEQRKKPRTEALGFMIQPVDFKDA